ncbi:MAG: DUF4347 domain-containing protein [Oscillatoria princeps RMCB-10]|nr:DUF4347 domain-containing protein [Oscillatoria princeps RMCB-10]
MNSTGSIFFIDSAIEDFESLVAGVIPEAEAVVLEPARCGVQQITEVLAKRTGICAIHIVCAGAPGRLQLGNTQLSLDSLDRTLLQQWADDPTAPELLLYGCGAACDPPLLPQKKGEQLPPLDVCSPPRHRRGPGDSPFSPRVPQIPELEAASTDTCWNLCTPSTGTGNVPILSLSCLKCGRSLSHIDRGTTRYWTGGGDNRKWSNPLNWSGEQVPAHFDRAVFDGTCTEDVLLDISPQIQSLIVTRDCTGTLWGWNHLKVEENALIAGGTVEVSLSVGGDLTIENATVKSYLSVNGDLTVDSGTVLWYGGSVKGNFLLKGGAVSFSSEFSSYYIFYGDFTRTGGTVEVTPIFSFCGSSPQTFHPGTDGMALRDLCNLSELTLAGDCAIKGFFSNSGTLTVVTGATLDVSAANSYSSTGTLIENGTIVHPTEAAGAGAGECATSRASWPGNDAQSSWPALTAGLPNQTSAQQDPAKAEAAMVWSGAGPGSNWSNPLNWSSGTVAAQ